MRVSKLLKLLFAVSLIAITSAWAAAQSKPGVTQASASGNPDGTAAKLFPPQVGAFRAQGAPKVLPVSVVAVDPAKPEDFLIHSIAESVYSDGAGKLRVQITQTASSSAAYSLLRYVGEGKPSGYRFHTTGKLGTVGDAGGRLIKFMKGAAVVHVESQSEATDSRETLFGFAELFAAALEGAGGFIPVLVLHLPEWDRKVNEEIGFAVSLPALREAAGDRLALEAVAFDGGAEAVTAKYGDARLVIVEFSTPQHAFDADAAINARVAQLRAEGQPAPSLYKREGNYSVFVFDAADAAAAEQLASGVKYEKDVRWLGRNPRADEIAARHYTRTMGGVILTTIIMTGVAILVCLGIGGAIGGFIFLRRRSRVAAQEVYSDAGGMMRLNLENLNTPHGRAELAARGEE